MQDDACPPIAIVGMALRLPGGINTPDGLWKFLMEKKNGVCEVPGSRYTVDSFYSEVQPNRLKTRHGYYLQQHPGYFDADFFSINAGEAERMDPQQRQLLEVVWECLENAGETNWRGKNIGCYIGVYGEDWLDLASKDPQHTDRYHALGTGQFALANRVSFEYDFQGPSMTLHTACSSSMVGLHEACQALYAGDCSSAIVAGTNLLFAPTMSATLSESMVLSPTGMCRTFDANADGYGRAEAINALYIKPLYDALRDNDPIRAVIRATSTNCDGRTPSITTPGSHSQEALIRRAYEKAGIDNITETGFFECHGTGTVSGDTVEALVVAKIFEGKGVVMGAVKPNVGHSEGASGITSVIKAVLALEHEIIPPNVFFECPNPKIPFTVAKLEVPVEPLVWPKDRRQRASVNCFGIGGTNAHIILESVSSFCRDFRGLMNPGSCTTSLLLVVSAKNKDSLRKQIEAVTDYANQNSTILHNLAYTLGVRREHLLHRAFVVAQPGQSIHVSAFQKGQDKPHNLTMVFTGQGAQWPGMGKGLIDSFPEVNHDIQMLDQELQNLDDGPRWSLREELVKTDSDSRVDETEFSQPLCTALQIVLVNVLRRWGLMSSVSSVVGHSSGEIAAAYAAGAITARSAIIIAYYRGLVAKQKEGQGAMAAVGLSREQLTSFLNDDNGAVIACENSPHNVTFSGDREEVYRIMDRIKTDLPEVLCRRLRVSVAYHSPHMHELGIWYENRISRFVETNQSMLPFVSTVTSTTITDLHELGPSYWRQNLESPVLFSTAVQSIIDRGHSNHIFLEVGAHSALSGPLKQIFREINPKSDLLYIPTLTRNDNDQRAQLLQTVGLAHCSGVPVRFEEVNGRGTTLGNLPSYSWYHNKLYWNESRLTQAWRFRKFPHHELLGVRVVESSDIEPSWRNLLRLSDIQWLNDHVLQGRILFPATAYIAMAGEAILQLSPDQNDFSIKNLIIKNPLVLTEFQTTEVITTLKPGHVTDIVDSDWYLFTIMSYGETGWTKHCYGQVRTGYDSKPDATQLSRYARLLESKRLYTTLNRLGFYYGPHFQRLRDISADPTENKASGTILDFEEPTSRYPMHPVTMDNVLQMFPVAMSRGLCRSFKLVVPATIGSIYVRGSASRMQVEASIAASRTGKWEGQATALAGDDLLLFMNNVTAFPVDWDGNSAEFKPPLCSEIRWAPDVDLIPSSALLATPPAPGQYSEVLRDAGCVSLLYVLETIDRLSSSNTSLASSHLVKWVNWLEAEVSRLSQEEDVLFPELDSWANMASEKRHNLIATISSKYDCAEHGYNIPFECMRRVFEGCLDVARGNASEDTILIAPTNMEKYYTFLQLRCDWSNVLSCIGNSNPGIRVLEIGAGTGSATKAALEHLKSPEGVRLFSTYIFSDISKAILELAQQKFGTTENIGFKSLDIAQDPQDQGFEPHSFDLIIASHVLHQTPNLDTSLRNIHQLLKSGGRLLLNEFSSQIPLWLTRTQGGLSDWRLVEDGRGDKLYISPETWHCKLRAAGFSGNDAIANDVDSPYQTHFTMLSRVALEDDTSKIDILLLTTSTPGPWAQAVQSHLLDQGYTVKWGTLDEQPPANHWIVSFLDLEGPYLYNMTEQKYTKLWNYLKQADKSRMLWVSNIAQLMCPDPRFGLIFGFARTIRQEILLDISILETDVYDESSVHALSQVLKKLQRSRQGSDIDLEYEFSFYKGSVHTGRCHWINDPLAKIPAQPLTEVSLKLDIGSIGMINTLRWTPVENCQLEKGQIEIDMQYIGLNFRDVMGAMGLYGNPEEFGTEGTGIVRRVASDVADFKVGDRVLVINLGVFRTRFISSSEYCLKIPDGIPLAEIATTPCAYMTCLYCLIYLARLQPGESVLIHSACGGVGLSAIRICQVIGAELFVTVGSEEKVNYLISNFGIPRNRIFNSRNSSFREDILSATNGKGVDVVLNSLSGKLLHASWDCVASFGRMIELGKRDFVSNGHLNMAPFIQNRSYFGFDLTQTTENPRVRSIMFELYLSWHEKIATLKPTTVYNAASVVNAFKFMQQGTHIGKILIQMPHDPSDLISSTTKSNVRLSSNHSYLLVGGLGGIGRSVSTWMVESGIRYLIYLSRSAGKSDDDRAFIKELEVQGCHVTCVAGSVTEATDVERAISLCREPLAGIVQMPAVLKDRAFETMTYDDWTACLEPKVAGTWNLHNAVQRMNIKLEFFVAFSSVSATCGTPGQVNYAAANTFLDSFSQYRRHLGLPSAVINLGAAEDIGLMTQDPKLLSRAQGASIRLVNENDLVEGLQLAICQSRMPSSFNSMASNSCVIGLGNTKPLSAPGVRPLWGHDARFMLYSNLTSRDTVQTQTSSHETRRFLRRVRENPAMLESHDVERMILHELWKQIARTPEIQDKAEEEISSVVVDSLAAIEIRAWLRQNIELELNMVEMSKVGTIGTLARACVEHLKIQYGVNVPEEVQS
ncbi:kinase subdomain-containing protein [Talaromyces proteolyticus]|uniref:Kinase subdomain-containing protein n=1 Tax=Talaromyces proteolyticus TaxID=1131652 RepID=A0AAD4PV68_9EURO|nr:kinase subdomain-containing protein [Talaromyces proteolyticus]KAH8690939.1 kinase subdomain-containing protein [Talaromyces proteolyticus]